MLDKTILLAGGTGLIGSRLVPMLSAKGWKVRTLTRNPKGTDQFFWDPMAGKIDAKALEGVSAIINLAGAGIADERWTATRKKELIDSRVKAAEILYAQIKSLSEPPKVYLSASAIGYYGNSGEQWMLEDSKPVDQSFMVDCCRQWELPVEKFQQSGIRTVKFRIGVVLAKEGGALKEIILPIKFGLGAYFGDGQAWWSWIHRDDVCNAFIWALENPAAEGAFNLVAPEPVRGKTLVQQTIKAMHRPAISLPAPSLALKLIFGEMSAVILNSNRISAEKLLKAGFTFQYPTLEPALLDIFAPHNN
jgi:uncharacterized protein (TIGR01777 family)